jgi:hypothetical protein
MKALSIKQPWASLIAHGIKDIENRTWKTNFRGRIYIHASGLYAKGGFSLINSDQRVLANMYESWKPLYLDDLPTSAIIGEVDIIDCVINHPSIWAEKSEGFWNPIKGKWISRSKPTYNWVLANPILYKNPILNVKGKLSFWEPDIDLQQCIWCSGRSNYEEMIQDNAGEDYCPECWKKAEPILKAEYDMLVKNGEIDPND